MASDDYVVVLSGRLVAGRDEEQVKRALSGLFKTSESAVEQLLAKAPVRIKKGVDHDTALRYKAAVEKAGALCELEKDGEISAGALEAEGDGGAAEPAPPSVPPSVPPSLPSDEVAPASAAGDRDIYAPPVAALEDRPGDEDFALGEPRKVGAGRGWGWLAEGFGSFRRNPLPWIGILVVWVIINMAVSFLPVFSLATYILHPIFLGGLMLGCFAQERDEDLEFRHLFAGFSRQTGRLAIVGAINLGAMIALAIVVVMLVVALVIGLGGGLGMLQSAVTEGGETVPPEMAGVFAAVMVVGVLAFMTGLLLILMAMWFAPALVALHEVEVLEALKLSFRGCLRNWLAFLVYSIVLLGVMFIAAIPLFLGFLVAGPMFVASIYAAYKDIYVAA